MFEEANLLFGIIKALKVATFVISEQPYVATFKSPVATCDE
jgi:hypothetical protein